MNQRMQNQSSAIRTKAPATLAARNSQPNKIQRTMPSSATRLVDANMKASASVRVAPWRKAERAAAVAAYEQELLAAPKMVARLIVFRLVRPKARAIRSLLSKTW